MSFNVIPDLHADPARLRATLDALGADAPPAFLGDFIDAGAVPYQMFPITQSNYREVLRNRSVEGYGAFFQGNY